MCKQWPCCSPVQDKFQFESVARINRLEDIQEKEGEKEKYGGSTIEVKRRKIILGLPSPRCPVLHNRIHNDQFQSFLSSLITKVTKKDGDDIIDNNRLKTNKIFNKDYKDN